MAGASGLKDKSILREHLSQEVLDMFNNGGVSARGGTVIINNNNANLSPFVPHQRKLFLYSAAVVSKTLLAMTYESTADGINYLASEASVQYVLDAPAPMKVWLRKAEFNWGTGTIEKGNIEIEGLSVPGVPDYLFVAIAQIPSGRSKTDADNGIIFLRWNDKYGTFDVVRIPSHTANGDRINGMARMLVSRTNAPGAPPFGGTLAIQWIDVAGALFPATNPVGVTSASNLLIDTFTLGTIPEVDTATGIAAASMPTLTVADVAGATVVTVTLPARLQFSNHFAVLSQYVGGGTNPSGVQFKIENPIDRAGGNARVATFQFGSIDLRKAFIPAGAIGAVPNPGNIFLNVAAVVDRDAKIENLDFLLVEFVCYIEPVGDDLSTY